jgi:hypothetical protein
MINDEYLIGGWKRGPSVFWAKKAKKDVSHRAK